MCPPTAPPASARTPRLSCGRTQPQPEEPPRAHQESASPRPDADRQVVLQALDAMRQHQVGGQHDESDFLSVMANMRCYGFSFHAFDQWAADAGCTCEREPRWQQPPASNQSDRPGWAIINLAAKRYGYEKPPARPAYPRSRAWSQPSDRAQPVVRDRTVDRRAHPDPRLRIRPSGEPRARLVAVDRRLPVEPPQHQ